MPPQLRGFGAGPGVGGPFHQPGFPPHGQPQGGPLGGQQYMNNAQINPFSTNGNAFGAAGFADTGFGSQSARMGFAHGPAAAMQPPQHGAQGQHNVLMDHPTVRAQPNKGRIREVWAHNLHEEMAVLRDLIDKYPYIAMVSRAGRLAPDNRLTDGRILSFQAWYQDRWAVSGARAITTISAYVQT
jgi:CCR4-NOT transcription complex subunit 7/8